MTTIINAQAIDAASDALARQLFDKQWCDIEETVGEGVRIDAIATLEAAAPFITHTTEVAE